MRLARTAVGTASLALLLGIGPGVGLADEAVAADAQTPPLPVRSDLRPRLTLDFQTHAWLTGGMGVVVGASQLLADRLAPPSCRWCDPPQIDRWARHELLWKDVPAATRPGNLLVVAVPVGAAVTMGLLAHADGAGFREGAEDLLLMAEATSLTLLLMQVAKFTSGRLRPDAWAGSGSTTANSRSSFFAGHPASAFAVAASTTQVLRMRGRPGWKWFAAVSFAAATATGFFRIASDNHWLTDVVAGSAIGTAVGFSLPGMVLYPASERAAAVTLVPAPGGLAILF
jgi:hypothetical protein